MLLLVPKNHRHQIHWSFFIAVSENHRTFHFKKKHEGMIMKQSSKYIDIIQWAGINYIFQRSINNLKVIPKKTSGSESGGPFGPIP